MNLDRVLEAFRDAKGRWKGCDWSTEFGPRRINLQGLTPLQARTAANATFGEEARLWRDAAGWLARVERSAEQAESRAKTAVELALQGQLLQALTYAREACDIEREFHPEPIWQRLFDAIERLMEEAGPVGDAVTSGGSPAPVTTAWALASPDSQESQWPGEAGQTAHCRE